MNREERVLGDRSAALARAFTLPRGVGRHHGQTGRLERWTTGPKGALVLLLLATSLHAQTPPEPAAKLLAAARAEAARTNRNVLVEFGASWCGWCHRFEAFLADSDVGRIMHDHFVVVHLTVLEQRDKKPLNNPGSDSVLSAMGGARTGIPFFFVLDAQGNKLADSNCLPDGSNVGHPYTPEEVGAFIGFLQKTAPRMTAPERSRIRAYLEKVAGR